MSVRAISNDDWKNGDFKPQSYLSWMTKRIAVSGWIGDDAAMAWVARQGVTHILNMDGFDDTKIANRHGIHALWNPVDDDLQPKPVAVFKRGVRFAHIALAEPGNKLLIHCAAGVHRAPMMALAVLGSLGWNLGDAMRHMSRVRSIVNFPRCYVESVERYLEARNEAHERNNR